MTLRLLLLGIRGALGILAARSSLATFSSQQPCSFQPPARTPHPTLPVTVIVSNYGNITLFPLPPSNMLDPLSALSVATAIFQFIDFSGKILKNGYELYGQSSGMTQANIDVYQLTSSLYEFQDQLAPFPDTGTLTTDERALNDVLRESRDLASRLLRLLDDLKVKETGRLRTWDSFRQACRAVKRQDEIARMQGLLESISAQIVARLVHMIQ